MHKFVPGFIAERGSLYMLCFDGITSLAHREKGANGEVRKRIFLNMVVTYLSCGGF